MTTEEQHLQRGKMVSEFQEAKAKLAALRSQAGDLAKRLIGIGQALQKETLENGALDSIVSGLPSKDEVQKLVSDVRTAQQTIAGVQKAFQQMGIDIS